MRRLATAERVRAFLAHLGREAHEPVTEGELYRFPAVDPPSLRRAVEAVASSRGE